MLGEMLSESRGKVTGHRVLPSEGLSPKMEISFQESGKLLGMEYTERGTYIAMAGPGGVLYGQGQGIAMTKDGEMATWTGGGVGKMTARGGASYRGAIYFQTASPKLARLNGMAVVFEHEVDENDNTHGKLWEWK